MRKEISRVVKILPSVENFRLSDLMIRVSRSVSANIAEGHGRYHFQENIQFCRQSRGSLYELLDHINVALDENYISEEKFDILKTKILRTVKILNGYISYLKRQKILTQRI
ncbi:MAG: four helix bundle protein [Candidatus Scalindua sp.]|nr:four helix bundle protein [Candidatus Scalindua sp.]